VLEPWSWGDRLRRRRPAPRRSGWPSLYDGFGGNGRALVGAQPFLYPYWHRAKIGRD
jgi:hypothetical protein